MPSLCFQNMEASKIKRIPVYSGTSIMRTPLVPSKLSRGVPTSEVSGIFPVGVAMRTRAVERYESLFQSSPLLYDGKKE